MEDAASGSPERLERVLVRRDNLTRVLAQLPDAQLFVLEGLNHFGSIMYPDLTASLCMEEPSSERECRVHAESQTSAGSGMRK